MAVIKRGSELEADAIVLESSGEKLLAVRPNDVQPYVIWSWGMDGDKVVVFGGKYFWSLKEAVDAWSEIALVWSGGE